MGGGAASVIRQGADIRKMETRSRIQPDALGFRPGHSDPQGDWGGHGVRPTHREA